MKLDVVEKKENPFLKRTDLILTVDHKGQATPKAEDLEKSIAEQFKSVPEKVEIVYIFSEVGLAKAKVKARVWKEKTIEKKKKKEAPKEEEIKAPKETEVEEKKEVPEKKEEPVEKKPEKQKSEEKKEAKPKEDAKPEVKESEKK
jgi:ribosomal protein S24E